MVISDFIRETPTDTVDSHSSTELKTKLSQILNQSAILKKKKITVANATSAFSKGMTVSRDSGYLTVI